MQFKNNNRYSTSERKISKKKHRNFHCFAFRERDRIFEYSMLVHFYQYNFFEPFERKLNKRRTQFRSLEMSRGDTFTWMASILLTKDKWNEIFPTKRITPHRRHTERKRERENERILFEDVRYFPLLFFCMLGQKKSAFTLSPFGVSFVIKIEEHCYSGFILAFSLYITPFILGS